jgi:iron complex transport system permease protein
MEKSKIIRSALLSLIIWVAVCFLALEMGAVPEASIDIIAEVRLPRVILASALGMGLSVAGAILQVLFSNPLCEPYTLGISSGSALGAVIGSSLGFQWNIAGITGTAFLGALLFASVLFAVSLSARSKNMTLLLTGVMLGFLGTSLLTLWIALSDSNGIQNTLIWIFGDLSRARLRGALFSFIAVVFLVLLAWFQRKNLDGFILGEEGASSLGVDVARVRRKMVILTSVLVGLCVSTGGMIGFIGLVVPHFSRKCVGSLHAVLIPFCAIWGGITLTAADCVSRIVVRPYELPIGVVTALIGAPLFMGILLKNQIRG